MTRTTQLHILYTRAANPNGSNSQEKKTDQDLSLNKKNLSGSYLITYRPYFFSLNFQLYIFYIEISYKISYFVHLILIKWLDFKGTCPGSKVTKI